MKDSGHPGPSFSCLSFLTWNHSKESLRHLQPVTMTLRVSTLFSLALLGLSQLGQALAPRQEATFSNPVIWADLADDEVFRVGDTYYYSASTMHYSPGAPLLRSYDLANWEFVSHSVPELPGPKFSLNGSDSAGYVNGVWASSLGYRESNGVFYWYGCIQGTDETHIYTASSPEGPWTHHDPIPKCYYDLGLLIDSDDTMYIAYGAVDIRLAQLSPDGFTEVRNEVCWQIPMAFLQMLTPTSLCTLKMPTGTSRARDSTTSTAIITFGLPSLATSSTF